MEQDKDGNPQEFSKVIEAMLRGETNKTVIDKARDGKRRVINSQCFLYYSVESLTNKHKHKSKEKYKKDQFKNTLLSCIVGDLKDDNLKSN